MKNIITIATLFFTLGSNLLADSKWYIGTEFGMGLADRTYDYSSTTKVDSTLTSFKIGKFLTPFRRFEFLYTFYTLENSAQLVNNVADLDAAGSDKIHEYKINYINSMSVISYKDIIIPYIEFGVGYAISESYNEKFVTHLGLGIMFNPLDYLEISTSFRYEMNNGSVNDEESYADHRNHIILGIAYKF